MRVRASAFYITAFLGAFLLFAVQPMMAKAILPAFGGSYMVWGASVVFYQAILLLGYLLAHLAQQAMGVRRYAAWHWLLLLGALTFFATDVGKPMPGNLPLVLEVARFLAVRVGVPALALSTTSLVLQRWLAASPLREKYNPYTLYAASNAGSMLALLSYPVLVEPLLAMPGQILGWWTLFSAYVLLHIPCRLAAGPLDKERGGRAYSRAGGNTVCKRKDMISWFALSMATCMLLVSTTNVITLDIASTPFLWTLPLSIYLLSFILVFKSKPWFLPRADRIFYWVLPVSLLLFLMGRVRLAAPTPVLLLLYSGILFVVCMCCHGELARRRPADPGHMTLFYVLIAAGGLVGSMLVTWLVPLVSTGLVEHPLSLLAAAYALHVTAKLDKSDISTKRHPAWATGSAIGVVLCLVLAPFVLGLTGITDRTVTMMVTALPLFLLLRSAAGKPGRAAWLVLVFVAAAPVTEHLSTGTSTVRQLRNYYGIYRVYDQDGYRFLQHGTTLHGRQRLSEPGPPTPLSYYHPSAPAGQLLSSRHFRFNDIGMIGLGSGALAAYLGEGQSLTIFELDPDNIPIAEKYFSYLSAARARGASIRFVTGDGRLSLRNEPDASFDLLILDAFNSGSIPVHLLTTDAIGEYMRKLKRGGMILIHISNRVLNLEPVIHSVAIDQHLFACTKLQAESSIDGADECEWMILCRDIDVCRRLVIKLEWYGRHIPTSELPPAWTDKYSNLLRLMF